MNFIAATTYGLIGFLFASCSKQATSMELSTNTISLTNPAEHKLSLLHQLQQQDARNDYRSVQLALTDPNHGTQEATKDASFVLTLNTQYESEITTPNSVRPGVRQWPAVEQRMQRLLSQQQASPYYNQYQQLAAFQVLFRTDLLVDLPHRRIALPYVAMLLANSENASMLYYALRNTHPYWSQLGVKQKLAERLRLCKQSVRVVRQGAVDIRRQGERLGQEGLTAQQLSYERLAVAVEDQVTMEEYYISKLERLAHQGPVLAPN